MNKVIEILTLLAYLCLVSFIPTGKILHSNKCFFCVPNSIALVLSIIYFISMHQIRSNNFLDIVL